MWVSNIITLTLFNLSFQTYTKRERHHSSISVMRKQPRSIPLAILLQRLKNLIVVESSAHISKVILWKVTLLHFSIFVYIQYSFQKMYELSKYFYSKIWNNKEQASPLTVCHITVCYTTLETSCFNLLLSSLNSGSSRCSTGLCISSKTNQWSCCC